jgi:hypothetical protein
MKKHVMEGTETLLRIDATPPTLFKKRRKGSDLPITVRPTKNQN